MNKHYTISKNKLHIIAVILSCLILISGCSKKAAASVDDSISATDSTSMTESTQISDLSSSDESEIFDAETSTAATAPIVINSEQEETAAIDSTIHMCFAGDILLSNHVLSAYNSVDDVSGILDDTLLSVGRDADVFMVNEEFPFSTRGTQAPDKQYTFRVDPSYVHIFSELGIDIVTLANNHILDYGSDALLDSIDTLDDEGIAHVGAGSDITAAKDVVSMNIKGKTIDFIGASRVYPVADWAAGIDHPGVFSTYDPANLISTIKTSSSESDITVVYVHWGIERKTEPEGYQRSLAQSYIDAGADIVIGSHPHVLQTIEYYQGKPIVYSLGNYLFGSSIPSTELLCVDIAPDGTMSLSAWKATGSAGKTVATGQSAEPILP